MMFFTEWFNMGFVSPMTERQIGQEGLHWNQCLMHE